MAGRIEARNMFNEKELLFVSSLYRSCAVRDARQFRSWALDRFRSVLDFDAAIWASVTPTESEVYLLNTNGLSSTDDAVASAVQNVVAEENISAGDPRAEHQQFPVRISAASSPRALGNANSLVASLPLDSISVGSAIEVIAEKLGGSSRSLFWFVRYSESFQPEDVELAQSMAFYLTDSSSLAFFLHLRKPPLLDRHRKAALVTRAGEVLEAQAGFSQLVVPDLSPTESDRLDVKGLAEPTGENMKSGDVNYSVSTYGDLRIVRVWPKSRLDRLSDRESQCCVGACRGLSNKEIASELGIAPSTVSTLIKRAMEKLDVRNKRGLREVFAQDRSFI